MSLHRPPLKSDFSGGLWSEIFCSEASKYHFLEKSGLSVIRSIFGENLKSLWVSKFLTIYIWKIRPRCVFWLRQISFKDGSTWFNFYLKPNTKIVDSGPIFGQRGKFREMAASPDREQLVGTPGSHEIIFMASQDQAKLGKSGFLLFCEKTKNCNFPGNLLYKNSKIFCPGIRYHVGTW